ncbi:hypothetical protein [Glycomyces salinus]|uniref:hypothetical protein n=1 Tax=Glycomyces salinus TaxID=980294 RepID=UPI0018EC72F9|nr:hypothetical protein [Glycomyces salinus]
MSSPLGNGSAVVEVVIDFDRSPPTKVKPSVYSALGASKAPVRVAVAPPDGPRGERLRRAFADDRRVAFGDSPPDPTPPYRLHQPPELMLRVGALDRLIREAERDRLGILFLACVKNSDMHFARLERLDALDAAAGDLRDGEELFDAVDRREGTRWIDGTDWAFDWVERPDVTGLHRELASLRLAVHDLEGRLAHAQERARHWRRLAEEPVRDRAMRTLKRRLRRLTGGGPR